VSFPTLGLISAFGHVLVALVRPRQRDKHGRAEQVIVAVAQEVNAELVTIRARERLEGHSLNDPASVGQTARFVVDPARCDVLLVRMA